MTISKGITAPDRLRANQWIVLTLGLNAWIVIDLWPAAFSANPQVWESYLLPLSPVLLILATRGMQRRPTIARWILLALFPLSLLVPVVLRSEIDNQLAFTPVVLLFAALSLIAYIALTADALAGHVRYRQSDYKPLAVPGTPANRPARVRLRRSVIALALIGTFCIAASGPALGGFKDLKRYWGEASTEGGLFVTLVSSTLAVAVLLSFLGPVLKADDGHRPAQSERKRKLISALILSLFGFLTFYLLQTR
jgi:hypothetical protein